MPSLLVKVRKKMTITAHRKVRNVLEGEYGSVFKGRSMDFDDLRSYVPGDDIKDVDWKATARSGQVLIRRYVAIRKHNILLVVDTGRSMAASAPDGSPKRDLAVLAAGIIAYVAQKHGDLVGLVAGDESRVEYRPLKGSIAHIEHVLQFIDDNAQLTSAASNMHKLLQYVARNIRRRMMLIVISDDLYFARHQEALLRRLAAQHELLFIGIEDVDPTASDWKEKDVYDINQTRSLPRFLRKQAAIRQAYKQLLKDDWQETERVLNSLRISSVWIGKEDMVVEQIVRLLEKQKHAKR